MKRIFEIAALATMLFIVPIVFGADQNTVAAIVATEVYDWSQMYEDANSSLISVGGELLPFQRTGSNLRITTAATPPTVPDFSYSYDSDLNTLTISFTIDDPDVDAVYVTAYAVAEGNIHVLDQSLQILPGVQTTKTYNIYPEPSAVYISFISEAPGAYPIDIPIAAPSFVVGRTILPVNFSYAGTVVILVSNGYSISPLTSTNDYTAYVVASRAGPVAIVVKPAQ